MKLRSGFITDSSSSVYIVENITNHTKTMLDLLEETAEGPWELVGWPHYKEEDWDGLNPRPPPTDPELLQQFREKVAMLETFPPHHRAAVDIAWGDGEPIFCPEGLHSSKSFIYDCED